MQDNKRTGFVVPKAQNDEKHVIANIRHPELPPRHPEQHKAYKLTRLTKFVGSFCIISGSQKCAFTLAEVLITLGVIGVVAAMTLPALIKNHQEKELVSKLITAYSLLDQGFTKMIADEETTVDNWVSKDERINYIAEKIPKYFSVVKHCKYENAPSRNLCNPPYKGISGDTDASIAAIQSYEAFVMKNGMTILLYPAPNNCTLDKRFKTFYGSYTTTCANIFVDVNGKKGPNLASHDLFAFFLVKDGIVPAGSAAEGVWTEIFENQCLRKNIYGQSNTTFCSAWVVYNKNMDYLHCDDLSWAGKKNCKK